MLCFVANKATAVNTVASGAKQHKRLCKLKPRTKAVLEIVNQLQRVLELGAVHQLGGELSDVYVCV